jgi:succinate-semialdehyde dehydrogenase
MDPTRTRRIDLGNRDFLMLRSKPMGNTTQTTTQTAKESISINPFNREEIKRYAHDTTAEVESALVKVERGFRVWRANSIEHRANVMLKMASILRRDEIEMAAMITLEMGKPIAQARAEILKCASLCEWYAEHGPAMLQDQPVEISSGQAYVSFLPVGAIFAVMPWNFPFWQVMRGAVAIMLGGNAYVLKHSSNVMGSAFLLRDAWKESGLPDGLFTVLNISHDTATGVIKDRRIAAVTVTGSVRAGSAVAATAGSVLKKSVLELGGADPYIVLSDADLQRAVDVAVEARFQNSGQVCIAAKRLIVEESVMRKFAEMFIEKVKSLKVGDPMITENYVGPMARNDLRDELHKQVQLTVKEGASLVEGGHFLGGPLEGGNFYAPTILAGVEPGMTAFREEVFGPVASLISARDGDHAVELANMSDFGLNGALWTEDAALARQLARRLEVGGVFVNGMSVTDPRVPVGGVKQSGYGRELSHFGLHEFVNAQTVWLDRKR